MPSSDSQYFVGRQVDAAKELESSPIVICELNALTDSSLRGRSLDWVAKALHTEFSHIDSRYSTLAETRETLRLRAESDLRLNKLFVALTVSPAGAVVPVGTASLVERDYPVIPGAYTGWLADRVVDAAYRTQGELRPYYEGRVQSFGPNGQFQTIGDALRAAVVDSVDYGGVRHYTEHSHVRKSSERSGYGYESVPCELHERSDDGAVAKTSVFVGTLRHLGREQVPADKTFHGSVPESVDVTPKGVVSPELQTLRDRVGYAALKSPPRDSFPRPGSRGR